MKLTIKCKRPEIVDKGCIFKDEYVNGQKRRYYFYSTDSSERYFVMNRQWYMEIEDG